MANTSFPRGLFPLRPYRRLTYYVANTGADLFLYQPVVLNNSGQIAIAEHTCGNDIVGSIVGFSDDNGGHLKRDKPYYQTGVDGDCWVAVTDHPEQEYLMEEDTGGTALSSTHVGNTCDFTYLASGTGNTTTGISQAVLDRSGVATNSAQLQLMGLQRAATGENDYGDYAKWVVRIQQYQYRPCTLGSGV